jgi:hypothetical protein
LRADPQFEWAKRNEPFYEFSNDRRFTGNTSKHGAYNFVALDANPTLQGVSGTGRAGALAAQNELGLNVQLTGVSASARLGNLTFTNVTPGVMSGVKATGAIGTLAINYVFDAQATLPGLSATGAVGVMAITGVNGVSVNLGGVQATGIAGTVNFVRLTLAGVSATGIVSTLPGIVGNVSASKNVTGVSASSGLGVINQGQLQQPILTVTSAPFVGNPTFQFGLDPAIVAGDTVTFQEQVAGGNWSSPIHNVVHTFTAAEITSGTVSFGFADLTNGNYEARVQETHGAVTSAWSNTVSYTVGVVTGGTPVGLLLAITTGTGIFDATINLGGVAATGAPGAVVFGGGTPTGLLLSITH